MGCVIKNKEILKVIWLQHAVSKSQGKIPEVVERANEWILVRDKIWVTLVSTSIAVRMEEQAELGNGPIESMTIAV